MFDLHRRHARGWTDAKGVNHETKLDHNCVTKCGIDAYHASAFGLEIPFSFNYEPITCLLCITSPL